VEEVARHHGLDKIGADIPPSDGIGTLASGQREERLVRSTLAAAGLNEVIQWAFGTAGLAEGPRPIPLANPLADPQSALRTSLVMPGLIEALETNARLGRKDVALFEVGRVFLPGDDMPIEERRLGILLAGAARAAHWSEKSRAFDVFDLIGVLESLLERLGVPGLSLAAAGPRPTFLHPGRSGAVMLDGEVIGWLGALGPGVREGRETVLVAEIGLGPLLARARPPVRVEPLPRFPAVNRDLSVACGAAVVAADLLALVRRAAGPWLRRVEVADRYDGHPLPPGKVSLMLSLSYQHPERTLAGEEVQASVEAVIRVLRGTGFEIRGD
jgi:phenylalanyl-tRNA synthetase beta chain